MNWKDIINSINEWAGLRVEIEQGTTSNFKLESADNCRFKLFFKEQPILWGTFGKEYWGVWILNNKTNWELNNMPIVPINSQVVEASKKSDYYKFWSRFFINQLNNEKSSSLATGIWTITIGSSIRNQQSANTYPTEYIHNIDNAFDKENPRWIEWDIGFNCSILALKEEPKEDNSRVKWFRKLVREDACPPVLVWFVSCIHGYIIIDGHARLKAFQLEDLPPKILVLNAIREEDIIRDPKVQQHILLGLEKRQRNQLKSKLNIEEINNLLIAAFDTRPYCRPITNAKAKSNFEAKWIAEVRDLGVKTNLDSDNIEDMIKREER